MMACKAGTGSRRISSIDLFQIVDDIGPPSGTNEAQWLAKANQESGYRVDCVNASGHTGLWQISPAWMQKLGTNEAAMRSDPKLQFRIAKRVYSEGRGWAEWNASGGKPSGAGQASITSPGDLVAGAAGLAESLDPVAGLVAPLSQIAGALTGFFEWLTDPNTWKRVALVVAGAGVLLVGGAAVARGTETGQIVESVAKQAATKGAAGARKVKG